jgi:hypothetical protein
MKFNHYDLGQFKRGQVVEVTLNGNTANVRLMESSNFQSYKNRRRHRYYGGLANSRFGIVVLSKDFIRKGWTNYELDGIITKSVSDEQIVLPIWHNITKKEVVEYSPSLADKLARNTATYTVEEIATEIAEVINDN